MVRFNEEYLMSYVTVYMHMHTSDSNTDDQVIHANITALLHQNKTAV